MGKYLISANYVGDGVKGLLKDGGTNRVAAVQKLMESLGGSVESVYYAFGPTDIFVIAELPDAASAAAASLTTNATGLVRATVTALLTPAEIDEASKKVPKYRAPGT